ncbi:SDR family NAD(P)-dependent oxidoreductase [Chromobacterium vaccinii]|uniref:SDR family NAD(P)-dependent oxidoreductase n=1 Tax=Chromobacterium vaccinii TaxID=1108595 RepID=UPI000AFAC7E1|nr:SDR family NAD(P)-dependent oxidoreductase [Chromobacterium vaccinii]
MAEIEKFNNEHLQELAQSYLQAAIAESAEAAAGSSASFDIAAPFGELGLDSFRILKVIKRLECDFGTLPKTLLFEHFNIELLAAYFVSRHAAALAEKCGASVAAQPAAASASPAASAAAPAMPADSIRMLEKNLSAHPELQARMEKLFAEHKNEGSVSRGTRNIAPNLFIGAARRGYFHYGRYKELVMAYAYTGPAEHFADLAAEFHRYCESRGYQLNMLTDAPVETVGETAFSSTPFGVVQRVLDIGSFTLEGGAMRRLRYQVSKFEKAGEGRTVEYRCGTDAKVDGEIAAVIDRWCEAKPMVNPLIRIVREEILAGRLDAQHRLFLTYLDGALQNVILISAMSAAEHKGYLMDLEFYPKDMPLGGLEFAIVNIIGALAQEGCDMLSLGGTYGCRLEGSGNADPEVDRILDDLHRQGIFNDEGNLQFKNKFRPENRTIYLSRPADSGRADNVIDIILMIADPERAQTPDDENHNLSASGASEAMAQPVIAIDPPAIRPAATEAEVAAGTAPQGAARLDGERVRALEACGFNPHNLAAAQVEFDLRTDSWAQLETPAVSRRIDYLRAKLQQPANIEAELKRLLGFEYCLPAESGRAAESLLCKAWPKRGRVLENLLFPSGLFHQIDQGYEPCELPHPAALRPDADEPFKGNLDWDALRAQTADHAGDIAFVCVEVCNNACGGQPAALSHLKKVKELLSAHGIALVIDATRVLENALLLIRRETGQTGRDVWELAREILDCADIVTASLAKDFGVNRGGVVAVRDAGLFRRLQEQQRRDGGGLDVLDKKLVGHALAESDWASAQAARRVESSEKLWQALKNAGAPIMSPAGGHCVVVDVASMPEFSGFAHPLPSFLAWLYLSTGIRAGAHSAGMRQNGPLGGMIRLAVPLGLKAAEIDELAARLAQAFRERANIPEVEPVGGKQAAAGDMHAEHGLIRYHRLRPGAESAASAPEARAEASSAMASAPVATRAAGDIAVVGMAGRYPQAGTLAEFWDNLREGRDCVTEMPAERLALRASRVFNRAYRGGFIDGIDRFDSLFFNISPREAEMLDPQERLFLEVAWEAVEDAGYYPEILGGRDGGRKVGVFVGAVWAMYQVAGVEAKLAGAEVHPNSFQWSIANRVSYWMNLNGPSLSVDTACSSSLTALHLACEAIRNGDCASAIVGGVNLDAHQHKFDINQAGGALSPDGVCRTFGAGANGYVAGEGVGALLLKPLDQALLDRDQVYGVIRASAVNHGGRSGGYTVPNPKAQGELIAEALSRARVDASSIGYIEAHGTGTELGDPVEIAGLGHAFAGQAAQSCAIGSVKTNIGHLEAAAGVAGVSKALLQIKHRQLAPSLHAETLNAHIDFAASPFQVQRELAPWLPKDGAPLRAGVSSFGAGGANAHVVLEQYPDEPTRPESAGLRVFPLSARSEEQLKLMAYRLAAHLRRPDAGRRLSDIAYTLQRGRKSFDCRLAVLADSVDALADKLAAFAAGRADPDVLSGNARGAEGVARLLSRRETEQLVGLLSASRDPRKLAQLWLEGLLPDCRGIESEGRRVSLPTYPFADKRHWISRGESAAAGAPQAALHPLLDSNESTFERQLFRKTFRAGEYFLADHVVSGIPTLPGTAYLELARKAGELAAGRPVARLRNVTWVSPLALEDGGSREAFVELKPDGEAVAFEVRGGESRQLHAQGRLFYADGGDAPEERIDLDAIRARCGRTLAAGEVYAAFAAAGMAYGPGFRVLSEVRCGDGETLGRLELPAVCAADFDSLPLHPSLLDAAMQAGVAALLGASGEARVPYSLGEVEMLRPLPRVCYSHVVYGTRGASGVARDEVAIVDEDGRVLVRIHETVGVPLASVHDKPVVRAGPAEAFEMLHYGCEWQAAPLDAERADAVPGWLVLFDTDRALFEACIRRGLKAALVLRADRYAEAGDHVYEVDASRPQDIARALAALAEAGWPLERICYAWPAGEAGDEAGLRQALDRGVGGMLWLCQALIERKPAAAQLLYLHKGDGTQPHNEGIHGFARSLELENPKLSCKTLQLPDAFDADETLAAAMAEFSAATAADKAVRYAGGGRQARVLRRLSLDAADAGRPALRQGGSYLITGGAGGLGLIFAGHLAERCRARLTLTGRSAPTPELEAMLEALRAMGGEASYLQADVATEDGARAAVEAARARFGRLDGILHGAGVLRDSLMRKKTREDMDAVLAPKVLGAFHLDRAVGDGELDFFAMFSSLAAIGGNAGQCDYAFANHYLDAFAAWRDAQRQAGRRQGRSLSLNWPLWAEGGMRLDEQTEKMFRHNLGMEPLATQDGLAAFETALASPRHQVAVVSGVRDKLEKAWGLSPRAAAPTQAGGADTGGGALRAAVAEKLKSIVTGLLKLGDDDYSTDAMLLDLGFDSIGLTAFANAINEAYGLEVNPVLFFEHPTPAGVADALCGEHAAAARRIHGGAAAPSQPVAAKPAALPSGIDKGWRAPAADRPAGGNRFARQPIAIVGIAGVMPQSENLQAFWDSLSRERNLVTEIPRDRWIWEHVHGEPVKDANKSYSRWGGFMKEVDKFDPLFFGITPREAEMMDPQQRLLIQTVWAAVEDAGHKMSDLSGTRTGLFVGASSQDYVDVLADSGASLDGYSASGNSHSILANRISFLFNLRGPSAPLDTACSSSLVALHRAVESIHTGSSEMAIVAGVQVMLTPTAHISLSAAGMLSPEGKCKTFDKSADGYVRGEGVGAMLIKPLDKARADGDPIYAVVRSTSENHGGRVSNLTAPNPKAQIELLTDAYDQAGIDPATVGYIECHGTGTSLGDPIEIQALKKSFADLYAKHGRAAPAAPHCGLSSVKTNIGHLEPAAGMAGMLKALLAMRNRQIPALLHFDALNPYIDLAGSPFYIVDKTTPWAAPRNASGEALPRRAGVSAFGWGGANAHVVLEEHVPSARRPAAAGPQLLALSAKNDERLRASAANLAVYLRRHDVDLADLAYTLQLGREEMDERLALAASTREEWIAGLEAYAGGREADGLLSGRAARKLAEEDALRPGGGDDLRRLAEAWVAGRRVEWAGLHAGADRRRLNLPGYPFARERYWIEPAPLERGAPVSVLRGAQVGRVLARPAWTPLAAAARKAAGDFSRRELLLCGLPAIHAASLAGKLGCDDASHAAMPSDAGLAERYRAVAVDCFERLQRLLRAKPAGRILFQIVVAESGDGALLAGLEGLVRSARLEHGGLAAQLVLLGDACSEAVLAERLKLAAAAPDEAVLRFAGREAGVKRWHEADAPKQAAPALRAGGVYLITGGLGGLGRIFARDILARAVDAIVVLTGRGGEDGERLAELKRLAAEASVPPARLAYLRMDPADPAQVEAAIAETLNRFGALNGVIHSAGMTRDGLIAGKTRADFERVLAPKVDGAANLDAATSELDLDFLALFSSASAVFGNAGQADYAAANGFLNQFAHWRNGQAAAGLRSGLTLSINWPLWEEGGMGLPAKARVRMLEATGMLPMRSETGLAAWHDCLAAGGGQTLVMEGQTPRLRRLLSGNEADGAPRPSAPARSLAADQLRQLVLADLRGFLAKEV